jgi:hypothetical protein
LKLAQRLRIGRIVQSRINRIAKAARETSALGRYPEPENVKKLHQAIQRNRERQWAATTRGALPKREDVEEIEKLLHDVRSELAEAERGPKVPISGGTPKGARDQAIKEVLRILKWFRPSAGVGTIKRCLEDYRASSNAS